MGSTGQTTSEAAPRGRRFHFRRALGRGGFGEVYLATMTSAGGVETSVAVKLLHADLDPESQAVQRLRDEGRILGVLDHPSILRVSDLVVLDGRLALVTEFVDGCDLDECWKAEVPIPDRPLVEIVGMVADALAAAWSATTPSGDRLELVHRDVKPSNIRVGRHGTVKLLDFGIARAHDGRREARTSTSQVMGSFLFMAPERLDLETDTPPGPPGDVFALGVTLFHGLQREPLFVGLSEKRQYLLSLDRAAFERHVAERLATLAGRPAALVDLLRDVLAHDPTRRPTASELARACERMSEVLDGPPFRRWCREFAWPEPEGVRGGLDGVVVTEGGRGSPGRLPASLRADGVADTSSTVQPVPATPPSSLGSRLVVGVAGLGMMGVGGGALGLALLVLALSVLVVGAGTPWDAGPTQAPPPVPVAAPPPPAAAAPRPVPEATAPVAPLPHPAAPPPAPSAEPAPAPVQPPRPAPPAASRGTWTVEGSAAVELRQGSRSAVPGPVEPGTWAVWADFGKGHVPVGEVTVPAGGAVVVRCNRIRMQCAAEAP